MGGHSHDGEDEAAGREIAEKEREREIMGQERLEWVRWERERGE